MNDLLTYSSRVLFIVLFGLTASCIPLAGNAQTWPEKPVNLSFQPRVVQRQKLLLV